MGDGCARQIFSDLVVNKCECVYCAIASFCGSANCTRSQFEYSEYGIALEPGDRSLGGWGWGWGGIRGIRARAGAGGGAGGGSRRGVERGPTRLPQVSACELLSPCTASSASPFSYLHITLFHINCIYLPIYNKVNIFIL